MVDLRTALDLFAHYLGTAGLIVQGQGLASFDSRVQFRNTIEDAVNQIRSIRDDIDDVGTPDLGKLWWPEADLGQQMYDVVIEGLRDSGTPRDLAIGIADARINDAIANSQFVRGTIDNIADTAAREYAEAQPPNTSFVWQVRDKFYWLLNNDSAFRNTVIQDVAQTSDDVRRSAWLNDFYYILNHDSAFRGTVVQQPQPGPQGIQGVAGPQGPIGPQGPAGPVGMVWRGPWQPSAGYAVNDVVSYAGEAWIATRAGALSSPGIGQDWSRVAAQGAPGPIGPVGPQGPPGRLIQINELTPAQLAEIEGPAGPVGPTGPPGVAWRGVWSPGTLYNTGDLAQLSGALYIAVQPVVAEPPTVSAKWNLFLPAGNQGNIGPAGPPGPQGPIGPPGTATASLDQILAQLRQPASPLHDLLGDPGEWTLNQLLSLPAPRLALLAETELNAL